MNVPLVMQASSIALYIPYELVITRIPAKRQYGRSKCGGEPVRPIRAPIIPRTEKMVINVRIYPLKLISSDSGRSIARRSGQNGSEARGHRDRLLNPRLSIAFPRE